MSGLAELFSVAGKSVLITGGSRGIGLMIARGFVAAGAHVIISSRKADVCAQVAAELSSAGDSSPAGGSSAGKSSAGKPSTGKSSAGKSSAGKCEAIPADLSTSEGVRQLADAVLARTPVLHVLVNNAGAAWGAPLEEYPDSAFDKVWAVNVKAVFRLTTALLPALRAAASRDDPARVITIGSVDGIRVPEMENYAYAASKSAVHMLTRQLAHALADDQITVNAIAPGPFESKMMAFALDDPASRAAIEKQVPLGRIGRPEDIAGAAVYLASRAGAYLTGAVIPVDGGLSTHG